MGINPCRLFSSASFSPSSLAISIFFFFLKDGRWLVVKGTQSRFWRKSVTIIRYFMYDHDLWFPSLPNTLALLTALREEASYLLSKPLG